MSTRQAAVKVNPTYGVYHAIAMHIDVTAIVSKWLFISPSHHINIIIFILPEVQKDKKIEAGWHHQGLGMLMVKVWYKNAEFKLIAKDKLEKERSVSDFSWLDTHSMTKKIQKYRVDELIFNTNKLEDIQ